MKKLFVFIAVAASTVASAKYVSYFEEVYRKLGLGDNPTAKVSFEDINRSCNVSKKLFDTADKNGDGYLTRYEIRHAKLYLFDRCDKDDK